MLVTGSILIIIAVFLGVILKRKKKIKMTRKLRNKAIREQTHKVQQIKEKNSTDDKTKEVLKYKEIYDDLGYDENGYDLSLIHI